MARKRGASSGGAVGLVVIAALAAIAYVPKEVWLALGGLAALALIVKLVTGRKAATGSPVPANSHSERVILLNQLPNSSVEVPPLGTWNVPGKTGLQPRIPLRHPARRPKRPDGFCLESRSPSQDCHCLTECFMLG